MKKNDKAEQQLIDLCKSQGATCRYQDGRLIVETEGYLDLYNLTALPEGVTISTKGYLNLRNLTSLSRGVTLSTGGYLDLRKLTTLPEDITISAEGFIDLFSLTTLPKGVTLSTGDFLDLRGLTTLSEGVTLNVGDRLDLHHLTTLPEDVSINARGFIDLFNLTTLSRNVTINAGGSLYLHSLTALPEGVTINAGDFLYLRSLTGPQILNGRRCVIGTVDGLPHRELSAPRRIGDATVQKVAILKGDWDDHPIRYLARQGKFSAHGKTARNALRDLAFKIRHQGFDLDEWAQEAVRLDRVTREDYHLATGACRAGVDDWLDGRIEPGREYVTVKEAIELCRGGYGSEVFIEALDDAMEEVSA